MKSVPILAGVILMLGAAIVPVAGQQRGQRAAPAPVAPAPPPAAPAPPLGPSYEPQLLRLSEILGAVTFLSDLCKDEPPVQATIDSETWRTKMHDLLEAEGQNEVIRDRLAGAYNRGVVGYQVTYRQCTPAGRVALDRLVNEGVRLSREIWTRFGS